MFKTKFNMIHKVLTSAVLGVAGVLVLATGVAHAIPYTGANTPPLSAPGFNAYTGVDQGVGDEPDFLRTRVDDGSNTDYKDTVNNACVSGTKFQMRVYVHNGASADNNQNGSGPSVAHGTKVKVALPGNLTSNKFVPSASISATNAATVNDTTTINCNGKTVKLKYVTGSASQFSKGTGVVPLSDDIVSSGVPIRSHAVDGDVWGCWDERVYVVLSVEVEEIPKPQPPVYTCELLTVQRIGSEKERMYRFNLSTTAKNGAVLKNVSYNFGDGNTKVAGSTVDHGYSRDGEYTTVATPTFTVDGKDVTAPTNPKCKVTVKTSIPIENCPIPGKENLPKDSKDCQETPVTPQVPVVPVIPSTGAGGIMGGLTGLTASAYGGYALFQKRRALKNLK